MRTCRTCGELKPLDEYSIDKRWKNTRKLDCNVCRNIKRRSKYNPEKRRLESIKTLYNLDYSELLQMYSNQNGCCSICKTNISLTAGKTKIGKAHIDHCHATGKVRGLLCTKCNTLLGMANDDITVLKEAICYLDRSQDD